MIADTISNGAVQTLTASLVGWPSRPKMRLVRIRRQRLSFGGSRPDPFGGFEHELDNELWHREAPMQVGNTVLG
jgi:hypothetical protein